MKCGEYIGELFRARDIMHIAHLQSKSMSEHVVLEELYDALLDHVDAIAEMRLARGPVDIKIPASKDTDVIKYIEKELLPMTDAAKQKVDSKGMNDIGAEIDMIKTTLTKKLYKLKNLAKTTDKSTDEELEKMMVEYKRNGGLLYPHKPVNAPIKKPKIYRR